MKKKLLRRWSCKKRFNNKSIGRFTLLGLPFTFAAIVRALWLRYKITNKRITIDGGWFGKNKTQVSLNNIEESDLSQGDSDHMVIWFLFLMMDQRLK